MRKFLSTISATIFLSSSALAVEVEVKTLKDVKDYLNKPAANGGPTAEQLADDLDVEFTIDLSEEEDIEFLRKGPSLTFSPAENENILIEALKAASIPYFQSPQCGKSYSPVEVDYYEQTKWIKWCDLPNKLLAKDTFVYFNGQTYFAKSEVYACSNGRPRSLPTRYWQPSLC